MATPIFSERVNAISNIINNMTSDPGERFGICATLLEIYRYELSKNFVAIPALRPADAKNETAETAPETLATTNG